jgi:hypothetical protein
VIPDLPPWTRTAPPARCPHCLTVPSPGDTHGKVMARDAFGQPLVFCYDDEGQELPADDAPAGPSPDPWTDPDAAAALNPPPF